MSKKGFSALKDYVVELKDLFENAVTRAEKAENRIAKLEAQLADANEMLEKCNSKFIVALEAEVKMLRKGAERYWCLRDNFNFAITQNRGYDWINLIFADEIDAAIDAAREGK